MRLNVIARSGRAVEAAGDVHTLMLDKTGTITFGNRRCSALHAAPGVTAKELGQGALLASLADDTAEGKSIVEYLRQLHDFVEPPAAQYDAIAFSAETRLSGIDFEQRHYRKGAVDAVLAFVGLQRLEMPAPLAREVERIAQSGGTPLLVCLDKRLLGVIHLKDVVKPGIRERFAEQEIGRASAGYPHRHGDRRQPTHCGGHRCRGRRRRRARRSHPGKETGAYSPGAA